MLKQIRMLLTVSLMMVTVFSISGCSNQPSYDDLGSLKKNFSNCSSDSEMVSNSDNDSIINRFNDIINE